jgi:hydrogenase maturation protease
MTIKVIFIGNPFGGDDGIGPYLYEQLKDNQDLKKYDMMELGVLGFDILNYVKDDDKLIIVDAVVIDEKETNQSVGKVRILDEEDLSKDIKVISQHDFGIEQTAVILRKFYPQLKKISIIGININNIKEFSEKLSNELLDNIEEIKKEVKEQIIYLAKE